MHKFKHRSGVSLLELLIYIAIFSIVVTVLASVFPVILRSRSTANARFEVQENMRFGLEKIQQAIVDSKFAEVVTSGCPRDILKVGDGLATTTFQIAYNVTTSPGTAAQTGVGTAWSSVDNALTSNNLYASVAFSPFGISQYIKLTNFGFNIPSNQPITGVSVAREGNSSGGASISDYDIRLVVQGVIDGITGGLFNWSFMSSDIIFTSGSQEDTWGIPLTADDINRSDFGVAYSVRDNSGGFTTFNLDTATITVYYGGVLQMRVGDLNPFVDLTSPNVVVGGLSKDSSQCLFKKISGKSPAKDTIQVKLKVRYNDQGKAELKFSDIAQTTFSLR